MRPFELRTPYVNFRGNSLIPLFAPLRSNEPLFGQMEEKFRAVLRSGEYILGTEVDSFESELAASLGYEYAVGCASGTEALVLTLRSLHLNPGDEVLTPAFSFIASASAIVWAGLTPRFVDIGEDGVITPELAAQKVTPKTRAIVAVDLYGRQPDIKGLRELCDSNKIYLIEDGAQSIGVKKAGAHFYCTSFYPTKNIGALGDAGAVLTDSEGLALRVRELSRHGSLVRDEYHHVGTTGRIDALQAAMLRLKLPSLKESIVRREAIARFYNDEVISWKKLKLPIISSEENSNVWALYTVRIPGYRRHFQEALWSKGIGCGTYYSKTLPRQTALERFADDAYPMADAFADSALSLPIYPELAETEQKQVVDTVSECARRIFT